MMFLLTVARTLLATVTFLTFARGKPLAPCSIHPEAFGSLLTANKYIELANLLQTCPIEVLDTAGQYFLTHPQLRSVLNKRLPPVSVDELYGCDVIDRRGRLSLLQKDGIIPRPIADLQTQMGNVVQRLMIKIQRLVMQYGWTTKSKHKSAIALEDSLKSLKRLLCCKYLTSCKISIFKVPDKLIQYECNDSFRSKISEFCDIVDNSDIRMFLWRKVGSNQDHFLKRSFSHEDDPGKNNSIRRLRFNFE